MKVNERRTVVGATVCPPPNRGERSTRMAQTSSISRVQTSSVSVLQHLEIFLSRYVYGASHSTAEQTWSVNMTGLLKRLQCNAIIVCRLSDSCHVLQLNRGCHVR